MRVTLDVPEDVLFVSVTRNSPMRVVIKRKKRTEELLEQGLLLCECLHCSQRWLVFEGNVMVCPHCASPKVRKAWRRLKIGLVPER
jgi:hypothetical protein